MKTVEIEKGEFSREELSLLESLDAGNERARGAISTILHESLDASLEEVRVEDQVIVRVFPHRKYAILNPADVHSIIKMGIQPYLQEQEPPKTSLRHQQ
ncbi:hypothetical protein AKJ42_03665 [candidate division MSBL1 archaeon SCGC-AAA261C02]|uniref:Uncharacterized protein n=1 Tax=candidate division MSBL1 archaeon SCGC-AAA261C02 TaxID=1698272 RepID=A0A133UY78_9EURY|nr:hypothetical protein AKJ42_03665 [candidate division MSBL1 archaeon SCGC-AAA261C02]